MDDEDSLTISLFKEIIDIGLTLDQKVQMPLITKFPHDIGINDK